MKREPHEKVVVLLSKVLLTICVKTEFTRKFKGVARIFGRGALSGAKRQTVRIFSRVRQREVPPMELHLGQGAQPPMWLGWQSHPKQNSGF